MLHLPLGATSSPAQNTQHMRPQARAGSSAYKVRLLGRRDLVVASPPVVTSPQRGEARRGEAQVVEATGGEHRPRCAPLPTSPRWGEELESVVWYEKTSL